MPASPATVAGEARPADATTWVATSQPAREPEVREDAPTKIDRERWALIGSAIGAWLFLILAFTVDHFTSLPQAVVLGLYIASYLSGGTLAAIAAVRDLFQRRVNVDLLMVAAALGAAALNSWAEGAILLGLFSTSNALEHEALGRTERAVRSLIKLAPETATVIRNGVEQSVRVEDLALDDVMVIRPGERIATDGQVIFGESAVNQATVTGESIPVAKRPGDQVFAGTINTTGALQVSVTKLAKDNTLARIVQVVEQAQADKSKTQQFTDAFEGKYAIGVILTSALIAIVPPLVFDVSWNEAFYRSMTLLVVASPCALVISTPAAILSALANAARSGVLFKGGTSLEAASGITTITFDKTGTVTEGKARFTELVTLTGGWDADTILTYAASVENLSEHHIGRALVAGAEERGLPLRDVADFRAYIGLGVTGKVRDARGGWQMVAVGTEGLFNEIGAAIPAEAVSAIESLRDQGQTAVFVGDETSVQGIVAVADTVRPQAAAAIARLKEQGIKRIIMLTGDNERVAHAIAQQVGIEEYHANLMPEQKLEFIRGLQASGEKVAMVGDGVNDAPALATADIGIAMGGAGTDVALETADVVLMGDDLSRLPTAIGLSRRTRQTIIQNLTFALGVIAILVTSTLIVGIPLPLGVVGHEGSTVLVVLNGLRLLGYKDS